jgi:hypothetical protein
LSGVVAAAKPAFLLPATETGSAVSDFFNNVVIERIGRRVVLHPRRIRELRTELLVCFIARDAPGADLIHEFLFGIDWPTVDVTPLSLAARASVARGFYAASGERVRVIAKGW